ncbi:lactate utilization protein [Candidatus Micrarchaeota archaeon]|nr:lactate utilization protein [Candidatus Micrarchaeota archaeon]
MRTQYSAENLLSEAKVDGDKWNRIPSDGEIGATVSALEKNGFKVFVVGDEHEALEQVKKIIPNGAEVMTGSSTTLAEIGFVDYLKEGKHGWENLHGKVLAESDRAKQGELRRKAVIAQYFLASANAVSQTGEIFACDASGSRVGAFLFAAKNLVIVAGVNKIVPSLNEALERIRQFAFPLENVRAQKVYGMGSYPAKTAILAREFQPRTTVILVKRKLGY